MNVFHKRYVFLNQLSVSLEIMLKILVYVLIFTVCQVTVLTQDLTGPTHDKVVVCYLHRWAAYREGAGKFDIFDIEPSLCTHIIYCFVGLDENTYKIKNIDPWQDLEENNGRAGFKLIVALKENNPHLKVSVAIGGWNEGSETYSKMAADATLRDRFIKSVVNFMQLYKFDGFDISWDYPTKRGGKPEDRENLATLVKELTEAFEPHHWLLTATIRGGNDDMNTVYDLEKLNFYLDYMHLMTYDYHGSWDYVTGANAPLRGYNDRDMLSVEYTVNYLLSRGLNANKLILGLPMYGRTFILKLPNVREIVFKKTLTNFIGFPGPFSTEDGFMGYNEICREFTNKSSEWIHQWHNHTATPYVRDDTRFITYDNPRSIAIKVKFAMDKDFGGVTAWSIATDDFRGSCEEIPDTYIDFVERFNKIADSPLLKEALYNLMEVESHNDFYVIANGQPSLQLPKPKFGNYPLLRTANEAISLALEETKVLNEMERIKTENKNKPPKITFNNKDIYGDNKKPIGTTDRNLIETGSPCFRTCSEICFYGVLQN